MIEVTACPVSSAPPESQGNMKEVGPQALAPTLAALLPACTGAAEFAAKRRSSHREKAEDWDAIADNPNPAVRDGKIVHALVAYELKRLAGLDPEPLDMLRASAKAQTAIDVCVGRTKAVYLAEQARGTHPTLLVEHPVDCLAKLGLADTCTGYCDSAIIADDTIYVYEFKSGTGPLHHDQVLAQCKLYALGLLGEFGVRSKIVLEIIKPGRNFDQCITLTSDELIQWGEETMVPLVRSALQGERTYRPGPHCNICPGRPLCRAWVTQMIAALDSRYGRGATVSPQQSPRLDEREVAGLLTVCKDIEACQRPLEEWAVGHIQRGGSIPGYQLHHNPGNLRFRDEVEVRKILEAHGLWERAQKLRSPFELRRAIGNDAYEQLVAEYAVRTPGKDVLRRDDTIVGGPAQ